MQVRQVGGVWSIGAQLRASSMNMISPAAKSRSATRYLQHIHCSSSMNMSSPAAKSRSATICHICKFYEYDLISFQVTLCCFMNMTSSVAKSRSATICYICTQVLWIWPLQLPSHAPLLSITYTSSMNMTSSAAKSRSATICHINKFYEYDLISCQVTLRYYLSHTQVLWIWPHQLPSHASLLSVTYTSSMNMTSSAAKSR
jgi:hypothetical protein